MQRNFAEDQRICNAATVGPWSQHGGPSTWYGDRVGYWIIGEGFIDRPDGGLYGGATFVRLDDALFTAEAREGWPAALAEIERLRAECERRYGYWHDELARATSLTEVLREIDTHIRSTKYPIPHIVATLKRVLPEYEEATAYE